MPVEGVVKGVFGNLILKIANSIAGLEINVVEKIKLRAITMVRAGGTTAARTATS